MKRDLEFAEQSVNALLRSRTLWVLAFALAAIIAVYWSTASAIVAIWIRSETFAHGFIVVPICLWLAWRKRETLALTTIRPWLPGGLLVLAAGALWFGASKAGAGVAQQFALAFMLQAACVTILGLAVTRVLAFPLAFLLFAVPAGEFLVPTLVDWTADFTVNALRASGVPVYREANHFVIPSGAWSVVEACSGIRYIIASVMVGTIYSALAYKSPGRRALFMLASVVVPIVANWMRAYMIVLLGHLSSNKLATGVDHLIYGWIFFGVVMLLLFWLGSFWQQTGTATPRRFGWTMPGNADNPSTASLLGAAALVVAVAVVWRPVDARIGSSVSQGDPVIPAIQPPPGWSNTAQPFVQWTPHFEGYRTRVQQTFTDGARDIGVYVAYYRNQSKGHEVVTSGNVLVEAKDWRWKQVRVDRDEVEWNGSRTSVDVAELSGEKTRLRAIGLYWVAGSMTSSAYVAKALQAWGNLTGLGDDAAFVVIYTPSGGNDASANAAVRAFARAASPAIEAALAGARGSGR
jgi:exosortase A